MDEDQYKLLKLAGLEPEYQDLGLSAYIIIVVLFLGFLRSFDFN